MSHLDTLEEWAGLLLSGSGASGIVFPADFFFFFFTFENFNIQNKTVKVYVPAKLFFFSSNFRNSEQNKCLWKLTDISEKSDNEGMESFLIFCSYKFVEQNP